MYLAKGLEDFPPSRLLVVQDWFSSSVSLINACLDGIIMTLKNREYVEMDAKRFFPTDIARIVNGFLTEHFTQYVDYDFTARLEDDLDAVSLGEKDWVPVLENFWKH